MPPPSAFSPPEGRWMISASWSWPAWARRPRVGDRSLPVRRLRHALGGRPPLTAEATRRRMSLRKRGGGRLPSLGQDHEQGHLGYVRSLEPASLRHLWTKPFVAPPIPEQALYLHMFAHLVEHMGIDT